MTKIEDILDFWFEGMTDQTILRSNKIVQKWFAKNDAFDQQIRREFEGDLAMAHLGQYKEWEATPRGRLALIILCDQFSRNMYRGTPKMFESDPMALDLTVRSIKEGFDKPLELIERMFLYMPLQHAEDLDMQKLSLQCFEQLVKGSEHKNPANTSYYQYSLDYAKRHHEIIAQFKRFPHRNILLARFSSSKEAAFLKGPNSSF